MRLSPLFISGLLTLAAPGYALASSPQQPSEEATKLAQQAIIIDGILMCHTGCTIAGWMSVAPLPGAILIIRGQKRAV